MDVLNMDLPTEPAIVFHDMLQLRHLVSGITTSSSHGPVQAKGILVLVRLLSVAS